VGKEEKSAIRINSAKDGRVLGRGRIMGLMAVVCGGSMGRRNQQQDGTVTIRWHSLTRFVAEAPGHTQSIRDTDTVGT